MDRIKYLLQAVGATILLIVAVVVVLASLYISYILAIGVGIVLVIGLLYNVFKVSAKGLVKGP